MPETTPLDADRRDHLARIGKATQFQPGNQLRRVYPKPPADDDPTVAPQIAERREQITADRGGREHLGAVMLGHISRFAVLETFVISWETYFLRARLVTRQGRVRSGFAPGYLAALAQLLRLGSIIGVERIEHPVNQSLVDWLLATRDQQQDETETETVANQSTAANTNSADNNSDSTDSTQEAD